MCDVPVLLRDTADGSTAGPTASFSMYMHGPGSYKVPRSANAITCSPHTQIHVMMLLDSFQFQQHISQQEADARWEMQDATSDSRHKIPFLFLGHVTAICVHSHMHVKMQTKSFVFVCIGQCTQKEKRALHDYLGRSRTATAPLRPPATREVPSSGSTAMSTCMPVPVPIFSPASQQEDMKGRSLLSLPPQTQCGNRSHRKQEAI
jgi:hypothetical protein